MADRQRPPWRLLLATASARCVSACLRHFGDQAKTNIYLQLLTKLQILINNAQVKVCLRLVLPKGREWALYEQKHDASGQVVKTPMGSACKDCWTLWSKCLRHEYGDFKTTAAVYNSDDRQARAKIEAASQVFIGTREAPFPQASVSEFGAVHVVLDRHYVALSEVDMLLALGKERLLKAHKDKLVSMCLPSEADVSKKETFFIFRDPERPYRTCTLRSLLGVESTAVLQKESACAYKGQGAFAAQTAWMGNESNCSALMSIKVPALQDFLAAFDPARSKGRPRQELAPLIPAVMATPVAAVEAVASVAAVSASSSSSLVGAAAAFYADTQPAAKAPPTSNVSPRKRPAVPSFSAATPKATFRRTSSRGSHALSEMLVVESKSEDADDGARTQASLDKEGDSSEGETAVTGDDAASTVGDDAGREGKGDGSRQTVMSVIPAFFLAANLQT